MNEDKFKYERSVFNEGFNNFVLIEWIDLHFGSDWVL